MTGMPEKKNWCSTSTNSAAACCEPANFHFMGRFKFLVHCHGDSSRMNSELELKLESNI